MVCRAMSSSTHLDEGQFGRSETPSTLLSTSRACPRTALRFELLTLGSYLSRVDTDRPAAHRVSQCLNVQVIPRLVPHSPGDCVA